MGCKTEKTSTENNMQRCFELTSTVFLINNNVYVSFYHLMCWKENNDSIQIYIIFTLGKRDHKNTNQILNIMYMNNRSLTEIK